MRLATVDNCNSLPLQNEDARTYPMGNECISTNRPSVAVIPKDAFSHTIKPKSLTASSHLRTQVKLQ